MKSVYTILLICCISSLLLSQELLVQKPILTNSNSNEWGTDNVILNNEPIGNMYGIQLSNGDIVLAVNDTLSTTNLGLVILKSTNTGLTWNAIGGITYRGKYEDIKLIKSSLDSVYCFFRIGFNIYSWNINTPSINEFMTGGYRTFDVDISSTNSIYIVLDSLATNHILRYTSINGGYNWSSRGNITSSGCLPKWNKSLSGDTLFLNYYGPVLADTPTSVLRVARYRETGPGTLASSGFQDLATSNLPKLEYKTVANNGIVWFIYTVLDTKSEIWARQSTDGGVIYGTAFRVNENETVNQSWFDIKSKQPVGTGFNLTYYSDSSQTGTATALTDKILFGTAQQSGTSFAPFVQVNDNPAYLSASNCKPVLVELPFSQNTGIAWVGETPAGKKIFWDTFLAIPVELISFTAVSHPNKTILNWSTATETNNQGFEIEKKLNNSWVKIGFVKGIGSSAQQNSYTFIDTEPASGTVFYRLKQIDFDGQSEYSNEIEVTGDLPDKFNLSQNFPNPFNPSTVINYQLPVDSKVTLKLFDILGKEVATLIDEQKEAGSHNYMLSSADFQLTSGIYFYQLKAGDFTATKKLILMK